MKKLLLFSASYPYGNKEVYLENELKILSKEFEQITIYPLYNNSTTLLHRELPDNVSVKEYVIPKNKVKRIKRFVKSLFKTNAFNLIIDDFRKQNKKVNLSNLVKLIKQGIDFCIISNSHQLKEIKNTKNSVFYFYWGDGWANILYLLTKRNDNKYYVRVHGGEIDIARANNYIPLRKHTLKKADLILPCSKHYANYLNKFYNIDKLKIKISYLGTYFSGINPYNKDDVINVVSVSNLIPLKRVELIISVLSEIKDIPIRWTHFGGGELLDFLTKKSNEKLSNNISTDFRGAVSNSTILDFYKENTVDAFINVSLWEGLPVSIMEAMSFGIPIIATDVGGTRELVDNSNGVLLPVDFVIEDISNIIPKFRNNTWYNKRKNSYEKWERNFNAKINYKVVANVLNY